MCDDTDVCPITLDDICAGSPYMRVGAESARYQPAGFWEWFAWKQRTSPITRIAYEVADVSYYDPHARKEGGVVERLVEFVEKDQVNEVLRLLNVTGMSMQLPFTILRPRGSGPPLRVETTLLGYAAMTGKAQLVAELLIRGARVNCKWYNAPPVRCESWMAGVVNAERMLPRYDADSDSEDEHNERERQPHITACALAINRINERCDGDGLQGTL